MYSGLGAYYLKNGQVATVLTVGDVMGFNVPGYSKVWLEQTQNGQTQFSGPFNLPMSPYTLQARDIGTFAASVYELTPGGTKGKIIGTDSIQVQPLQQVIQQTFAPPTIQQIQAPGYTNPSQTPGGQTILSTGVQTPAAPVPSTSIYYQPGPAVVGEAPGTTDTAPTEDGGISTGMLIIAGLGLLFLFSGRGRR